VTLDDGTAVTPELFERTFTEELAVVRTEVGEDRWASGRWTEAAQLMRDLCLQDEFAEFLTLSAYERL
jgi:malate synthase